MAADHPVPPPGEGPASSASASIEKAAQRRIERDGLDELLAGFDEANGPADPVAVAAKRTRLGA
ncbi:hypothetical protein H9Y04_41250 [Streptomyces sp. TRM66268-LWL]|uniref:Uncharacterized protein n=1 Tax=Streptomyces polyasparticus TaxID=2767826 RepID=A0ABR7SXI2_9ACTN|nr:hypothetical protein [Streptomyces polyasparticus]MBC9718973.1 hypothetical protein [Streptomyces polyasparticus]